MERNSHRTKIVVTGGAGFLGHHFVEHLLKNTDWDIIVFDKLSYASNGLDRLRDIDAFDDKRVLTLTVDFTKPISEGIVQEVGQVDYIVHMGAETHVDRSIDDATPFVLSNVLGTMYMLEFARKQRDLKLFNYFSTDEVYGPAPKGFKFKECDRYNCTNPYSATKAGGEQLCNAYANTYDIPMLITNTMNVFGERQHPEKYIPLVIRKVLLSETVQIHADHMRITPGSRYYIHARNVASAILYLLKLQYRGRVNVVGDREVDNLVLAKMIAMLMEKELKYELVDFHSSRPGHDLRYALDGKKLHKLGWRALVDFEGSLIKTIEWTLNHKEWLGIHEYAGAVST